MVMPHFSDTKYEMVGQDILPDFPTPVVVQDAENQPKWTVSIPRNYDFPLSTRQYSEMSGLCREASARARDLRHKMPLSTEAMLSRDKPDDLFVDIMDAEKDGLLSAVTDSQPPKHSGQFAGAPIEHMPGNPVCDQSLTYVLESLEAGLGEAVMALWTLYALAKEQGRAFFIDDSRWAYGTYTDLFQPPPVPDCRPPPRHQMLPCPVQSRHLVVSSVTIKDVLPTLLARHQRRGQTDLGTRDLFELAHEGYKSLFRLTKDDQAHIKKRIRDIRARAQYTKLPVDVPVIGLHIRRGDGHPFEPQYREGYIPTEVFAGHADKQIEAYYNKTSVLPEQYEAIRIVASDDPMVHEAPELSTALLAQERIRLATKKVIEEANADPHYLHHSVDEAFGWEGGFFAAMFWNLGAKPKTHAAEGSRGNAGSEEMLKLRSLVGRAYMMDLAALAGASDKVVCAVSAMGCRLLAVMMGWERAMDRKDWINVDGDYGWSGLTW